MRVRSCTVPDRSSGPCLLSHHGYVSDPFLAFTIHYDKTGRDRGICIPIDSSDEATEVSERKALEQIRERDYIHGLEGPTLLYGIAFRNKRPTALSEMDIRT